MGVANAAAIRDQLQAAGRAPETPVAIVEWGTCEAQRVVTGTLETLPDLIAREHFGAPSILVIGEAVRLRERLDWHHKAARPLETCPQ
jgi:siroheme synthase